MEKFFEIFTLTAFFVASAYSKCFQPAKNLCKISSNLTSNENDSGCNLCGMPAASTSPEYATFQSTSSDVPQMTMKCASMCASSPQCVAFNFRKNRTTHDYQVHCQFFTYYPQLYISIDSCVYFGIKSAQFVQVIPSLYSVNSSHCSEYSSKKQYFVMQRRMDGSENFYKNWTEYKNGFGNPCKEFWIGNDNLHRLTSSYKCKLLIVLEDFEGNVKCAAYDSFVIGSPSTNYILNIGNYIGTAGDSLTVHNEMPFSTFDKDQDKSFENCAALYQGAWWYNFCHEANLNGKYLRGAHSTFGNGIIWKTFRGFYYSLKFTEMRVELI